jgi:hypothetical protein
VKYDEGPRVGPDGAVADDDGWYADSVWEYHLRPDELPHYHAEAARYINRLLRIPPAARKRLKQVTIRCPVKGCLLATVYEFSRFATAEDVAAGRDGGIQYLYVGQTPAGTKVWDLLNYACACNQVLYWRAGCRCGFASLCRVRMMDLFFVADRVCLRNQTEAEAIAVLPEHLRRFWGKRVFHPDPAAWHAKKPRTRLLQSRPTPKSRPRWSR